MEENFERAVAAWFAENTPPRWRDTYDALDDAEYVDFMRGWQRTLNTRGFGAAGVPREWGGGGYSLREQAIIHDAWARAEAPGTDLFEISINHVPSTFLIAGTQEQKDRYIRAAIEGEIWCQGFSEPGAGSDLAALKTAAVPDGGDFVVSGQKIWSSHAQYARYCLLLARTDPKAPAHKGITYFILDMQSPGITVRPIRQSTGKAEFCELFLDEVRIPAVNIIGALGDGWRVAQSTLTAERGPIGMPTIASIGHGLEQLRLRHLAAGRPESPVSHVEVELARLTARNEAVRSLALDTVEALERGTSSGELASAMKVSFSQLLNDMTAFGATLDGESALLDPGRHHFSSYVTCDWAIDWVQSWAWTIAGGTNEIQRNIVSERILGLPREPRPTGAQG